MTVEVTNEEKSLLLSQMVGAYLEVEDDTLKELNQTIRRMNNEIRSHLASVDFNTYYLQSEQLPSGNIPMYLSEFINLYLSRKLFRNTAYDDMAPIVADMHEMSFYILANRTVDPVKDIEKLRTFASYIFNVASADFSYYSEMIAIAKNLLGSIKGLEIDSKNIVTP